MPERPNFFQGELSRTARLAILAVSLLLLPAMGLPVWRITLHAPQYPEGLEAVIYPHTVSGDLREVNLLNHYIGMQEITPDEFPEFRFIPFFILRFLGLALLATAVARIPIAALGWLDFVVFGLVMLFDFQHWLQEYGQNLAPDAPIRIEPFTPHLLGVTKVGQFTVTSYPAVGAILMAVAGLLGPIILFIEWKRWRKDS